MSDGLLVEVLTMTRGSATTAAHSAGATAISIENPTDFDATGGQVEIADGVYDWTAIDEAAKVLTITPGLTDDVAEFEPVLVRVGNKVAVDYYAEVHQDEGEAEPILVPLRKREVRLAWPVKVYDPPLPVNLSPDLSEITEADGVEPEMDGAYIDPTTIPTQVPTEAPAESPVVVATGLADWIVLQTEELDAATTLLTFQVSLDGSTWDDLNDEPVRSRVRVVKALPDGTPLSPETVYYFRTIASNIIGTAAPSASVTAQLDQAAVALVAQQLITAEVIAGFALLGTVHIGGDAFTLTPPGTDPENLPGGLRIELTDGGLIHLPADGSDAVFSGDVVAAYLETVEGARLGGEIGVFGNVTMAAAAVPDPLVAPTVQSYYSDTALPISNPVGLAAGLGGADWATISGGSLASVAAGAVSGSVAIPANSLGVTSVGGSYWVLHWRSEEEDFAVSEYDSALVPQGTTAIAGSASTRGTRAHIGNDGTNLVVGYEPHDGTDWAGDVTLARLNTSTFAVVSTIDVPSVGLIGGVSYGDAGGEFAASRWILHPRNDDVQVFSTAGVQQVGDEWPRPYGKTVRGLYDSHGGEFDVIDNAGVVRHLVLSVDAPAATYWWSYAWVDADTHTTLTSPETSHTRPKRAQIAVTCSPAPQQEAAGTHVANQLEVFAALSSGGTKESQGVLAVGSKGQNFTDISTGTGGAPGSNNWSGVSPTAVWSAETGGFTIDGESDGDVGTGTFRDSVDARVTALAALASHTHAIADTTGLQAALDALKPVTGGNAAFNDVTHAVNTTGKYDSRPGYNTVSDRPIWASGSAASAVWKYADGTTAHTPV